MHAGHPIVVQDDRSQNFGTRASATPEMLDRQLLHFAPPIFRPLLHLLPIRRSVPRLFLKEFKAEAQVAHRNYVMMWYEIDDLER